MMADPWFWAFNAVVLLLLAFDLFVFHRREERVSLRNAAVSSLVWVSLSLAFAALVWVSKGRVKGMEFFAGYLIEYALSVDNLFVFVLIFAYFKVDARHQHRVLFWGIIGAIVMRGAAIALGVELVRRFEWTLTVFGLFLVVTGVRMFFKSEGEADIGNNPVLRFCRSRLRIANEYRGPRFWIQERGVRMATPLFLVLLVIDVMDLVFAVDSIPAVFAVTRDPFIVYTSNICAILGLRSMYFLLAGMVDRFVYLKYGLAAVLSFIGVKMLIAGFVTLPIGASLAVVAALLLVSVVASFYCRASST